MGRPYLTDDNRDDVIARIDGLRPVRKITDELEYPVGPQYEKGEERQRPKRERAREMPIMQLCARVALVMAMLWCMTVGVTAAPPNPILSLQASRIGTFDVHTTVNIVASAENVAVCVGLAGEQYHARWGCQFVTDKDATSVTIVWRDVPYADYAIDAGLMRAQRPSNTARKIVLTSRRSFGVVKL